MEWQHLFLIGAGLLVAYHYRASLFGGAAPAPVVVPVPRTESAPVGPSQNEAFKALLVVRAHLKSKGLCSAEVCKHFDALAPLLVQDGGESK